MTNTTTTDDGAERPTLLWGSILSETPPSTLLLGAGVIGLIAFVYFLPFIVAVSKRRRNTASIFVLNLFFGWTLAGWVVALVWAAKDQATR